MQPNSAKKNELSPDFNICLVGAGKVGRSLFAAFRKASINCTLIKRTTPDQQSKINQSDLVLITTQDGNIESTCEHLAPWVRKKTIVAHCSGALNSLPLRSVIDQGVFTGCAHPLNTFPNLEAAQKLLTDRQHSTYCYLSGDSKATDILNKVFTAIGFNTSYIDDNAKIAYHAACVFLCNYLTSISETGLQIAESAGLNRDEFWQAVTPLMRATLDNISRHGTQDSLSGPIARGDHATISKHLNELSKAPKLTTKAYKVLGQQAINLAEQSEKLEYRTLQRLRSLLDD